MEKGWRMIPINESDYEFVYSFNLIDSPDFSASHTQEGIQRYQTILYHWCKVISIDGEMATIKCLKDVKKDNNLYPIETRVVNIKYLSNEWGPDENDWRDAMLNEWLDRDTPGSFPTSVI